MLLNQISGLWEQIVLWSKNNVLEVKKAFSGLIKAIAFSANSLLRNGLISRDLWMRRS